jgi:hypothetical protein
MRVVTVPLVGVHQMVAPSSCFEAVDRLLVRVVVVVVVAGGDHDPPRPDDLIELLGGRAVGAVVCHQKHVDALPVEVWFQFVRDPVGDVGLDVAGEEESLAVELE